MGPLIDVLIYLIIFGGAALVIGGLLYGIHTLVVRVRYINARMIWRTIARHRHV